MYSKDRIWEVICARYFIHAWICYPQSGPLVVGDVVSSSILKSSLVDVEVFYCIHIRSLLRQICEQMHWTDSYSKVTWCKSSELDKHDRCCNGVACTVGHLRRPIPHLNPTPAVDID